jgi:hypothetical protein
MTRDQIIAKWNGMSPRERDAWVAEVVFEWDARRIADAEFAYEIGVCGVETIPQYTEDIAAAWVLTEENESWGVMDIDISFNPWKAGEKSVTVGAWVSGIGFTLIKADTAPEAICLAATIAKLSPTE